MLSAEEHIAKAIKKIKKNTSFMSCIFSEKKEINYENAIEHYQKAAGLFKTISEWNKAANCYLDAANLESTLKSDTAYCSNLQNACDMWCKSGSQSSLKQLDLYSENLISKYNELEKVDKVGDFCAKLGDRCSEIEKKMKYYNRAVKSYNITEHNKFKIDSIQEKITVIKVFQNDFTGARDDYVMRAMMFLDDRLKSLMTKKILFNAMLCQFATISKNNMTEYLSSTIDFFDKCKNIDPKFDDICQESMLIKNINISIVNLNVNLFDDSVESFDNIIRLTEQQQYLLGYVRKIIIDDDIK
jgi:tetratricopeptide (TPR) repeat protein